MTETAEAPRELMDRIKRMTTIELADIEGFEGGNPVDRTTRDEELLDNSLETNGLVMPPLVREKGKKTKNGEKGFAYELIDGHGRIESIQRRFPGTKAVKCLVLDVSSVAEGRKIMLGLRNNARWNMDELDDWMRDALGEGLELETAMKLTGYTAADLEAFAEAGEKMLDETTDLDDDQKIEDNSGGTPTTPSGGMVSEVDIPDELPKKTITRVGDVWMLGESRLVCGDMTVPEIVAAALAGSTPDLLWTDPPWNVAIDAANKPTGRSSTRKERTSIKNDNLGKDFPDFAQRFASSFAAACPPGTPIYVAMSTDEWGLLHDVLTRVGFHWSSTIIWVKNSLILSRKDFHPQYEPIWYGWREGAARKCSPADRAVSDVWPCDRPRKSDLHPTMKPIALVARSINASTRHGDLVLDTFGGSGTTLLAAEQMGRRAALTELDPAYCDVIVERWQKLTGRKAKRKTV